MVLNLQTNKVIRFTKEECSHDFSLALSLPHIEENQLQKLFPIVSNLLKHFIELPQSLLIFNSNKWSAAKAVIEANLKNLPLKVLQDYDQESLFGRLVIHKNDKTELVTGILHQLDTGVLALHISPMLSNPKLWFLLKSFLICKKISIKSALNAQRFKGKLDKNDTNLATKIILVSNSFQIDELTQMDPEFTQVSSLFIELPRDLISTDNNIQYLKSFCSTLIQQMHIKPLAKSGYNALFHYLSSQCEHQQRVLFAPKLIENVLRYAQLLNEQAEMICDKDIESVLHIQDEAQSQARKFSEQALIEKQINLQLSDKKIGQINGLSVVELIGSSSEFGEIFRVSASDMIGDGEIIDVERKVELAGSIHAKSTLIVQGYLNHFFTHIVSFPFSCNVVFEQSYQESDGDSASLAVLLAATSCYSHLPIQQNLFVTGALDQHGNVLAIGGINYKIKAVVRLFQLGLLTDPVSILMPKANQVNLMLDTESLEFIKSEKINIFGIEHCNQAFPIAMETTFEEAIKLINKRIIALQKNDESDTSTNICKLFSFFR
jgi:Lon-like ATP-dependent protease